LFAFSAFAVLLFTKIPDYSTFFGTTVVLFESSMGSWSLALYKKSYSIEKSDDLHQHHAYMEYFYVGQLFHIVFLMTNLLILLNLIIAIMSDTYAFWMTEKYGVYFKGII